MKNLMLYAAFLAAVLLGTGCKYNGKIELDEVAARYISVESCEGGGIISCKIRNLRNVDMSQFNTPVWTRCYDKDGAQTDLGPGRMPSVDAGGVTEMNLCAEKGVKRITFTSRS